MTSNDFPLLRAEAERIGVTSGSSEGVVGAARAVEKSSRKHTPKQRISLIIFMNKKRKLLI
jgi:hypothetical protein